ncbi:hypothetical protein OUZ56_030506 [Daphnia magna]|uniref:Uncharacterized protein n=1 Tax=Daphnia magna TaxID=35525 RepID=A0ABQ9ZRI4_9CRUS|nr:hypothetical protein OUZ56_030506 [Daphnia magna]
MPTTLPCDVQTIDVFCDDFLHGLLFSTAFYTAPFSLGNLAGILVNGVTNRSPSDGVERLPLGCSSVTEFGADRRKCFVCFAIFSPFWPNTNEYRRCQALNVVCHDDDDDAYLHFLSPSPRVARAESKMASPHVEMTSQKAARRKKENEIFFHVLCLLHRGEKKKEEPRKNGRCLRVRDGR